MQNGTHVGSLIAQLQGITQALQSTGHGVLQNTPVISIQPILTSVPGMNKNTLESSLMGQYIELNDFLPSIAASR